MLHERLMVARAARSERSDHLTPYYTVQSGEAGYHPAINFTAAHVFKVKEVPCQPKPTPYSRLQPRCG